MEVLTDWHGHCPYCGERFDTTIDCSIDDQEYIEDCQVCCRPILLQVKIENQGLRVEIKHENDV